jgi:hypothetical protein
MVMGHDGGGKAERSGQIRGNANRLGNLESPMAKKAQ